VILRVNPLKSILVSILLVFVVLVAVNGPGDIPLAIAMSLLLGIVLGVWAYAALLLIDSDSGLYQAVSVIMTGVIGILVLLGLRWGYRKTGMTFMD
jgi:hypothetical protein